MKKIVLGIIVCVLYGIGMSGCGTTAPLAGPDTPHSSVDSATIQKHADQATRELDTALDSVEVKSNTE